MKDVTVAMVALGGYGNSYLRHLLDENAPAGFRLVAGIDPNPVGCRYLDRFEAEGIPIYPDLAAFYAVSTADLVIIAAPIQYHAPFTCTALAHGSNVLCEKPVAATVEEARAMAEAEAAAPGWVGIGYQWSFSTTMQALKADVMAGRLGRPLRLRTKVLWPRPLSYYHRNRWAGRIAAPDGQLILDSPVANATAHYLHNCFYILGPTRETSARPVDVQAELYRANAIENYDTGAVRTHTEDGAEILFYAAHPVDQNIGPELIYEFEEATVTYAAYGNPVLVHFRDGTVKDYGDPFVDEFSKIWQAIDAVRTGAPLACSISAATSHTLCVNGAQASPEAVVDFPLDLVRRQALGEEDTLVYVEGLVEVLEACYDGGELPSELGNVPWAQAARRVDLREWGRGSG
jgi:predicted dehydrogenase